MPPKIPSTTNVWRLRRRPVGDVQNDDLSYAPEPVPTPSDGQLLIRTVYLSLDPTNRIWMSDMDQYMPPVALDDPMRGVVCGEVVESKFPSIEPGSIVSGLGTWAEYQVVDGASVGTLDDTGPVPLADAFGLFAIVGPTAYFGLLDVGQPKSGETVLVSGAAGAVGALVGQIAKIQGCRAIGIAGSDDKCARLTGELGFDGAINYRRENVAARIRELCPDGVDVYFDNVGGEILDAALLSMALRGRVVTCGLISVYNATERVPGPYNYGRILMQRLRVEGFVVLDYLPRFGEAIEALIGWMAAGQLRFDTDVYDGLENALETMRRLYSGEHSGKLLVRVGPERE